MLGAGALAGVPANRKTKAAPSHFDYFRLLSVLQKEAMMVFCAAFRVLTTSVWEVPTAVFITSP
jgi:hypothetical protein